MCDSQRLDSVTFNCLNQTKLVSTALCVYLLFGHRQSRMQLLALALLLTAALMLQADSPPATASAAVVDAAEYRAGVLAILLASMLSVRYPLHVPLCPPHPSPSRFRNALPALFRHRVWTETPCSSSSAAHLRLRAFLRSGQLRLIL
jgi:hypothetical protein